MEIFILLFFCINIAFRAKMRGLNAMPWVVYTILAIFAGIFVSSIIIYITWVLQYDGLSSEQLMEMMKSGEIAPNEWNMWFVMVCAFGGYLLMRYRIEKHPKLGEGDNDGSPPQ